MTIQAAIVSPDTFALDSRNLYLPGLITYEDGPAGSFVLTITPIGSVDLDIGVVEVIIGSADLQALRAIRDENTHDGESDPPPDTWVSPSNPPDPSDCYDCRTNQQRLNAITKRVDELVAESAQMFSAIERRMDAIEQLQKRYDRLRDRLAALESEPAQDETLLTVDIMAAYDLIARRERAAGGA